MTTKHNIPDYEIPGAPPHPDSCEPVDINTDPADTEAENFFAGIDPVEIPETAAVVKLRAALHEYITPRFLRAGVPQDLIVQYIDELTSWNTALVDKFERGQHEHGGDFRDADMQKNMAEEILDITHYQIGANLQRRFLKVSV